MRHGCFTDMIIVCFFNNNHQYDIIIKFHDAKILGLLLGSKTELLQQLYIYRDHQSNTFKTLKTIATKETGK